MHNTIIVTRHKALVEYLHEIGLISNNTIVLEHVTEQDVINKDVIGILPLRLAALANSVTEIPLNLSQDDRGKELDLNRLKSIVGKPCKYKVNQLD